MCVYICAHALTFLFLTDLLHQASDLDILFPLFTSRGRCTAAFWKTQADYKPHCNLTTQPNTPKARPVDLKAAK